MALKNFLADVSCKKSLSSSDISKVIKTILYDNIKKFDSVSDLLGDNEGIVILYQLEDKYTGHWVLLFRNNKGELEYFDSYGKPPDFWIKKSYNNSAPYLDMLIKKSGEKVLYNHVPLQGKTLDMSTCGRWCLMRWKFRQLSLRKFLSCFSKNICLTPDELICLIV